jgi:hypothetical protein
VPDVRFKIEGAEPAAFAAAPTILFKLRIENEPADESIHSIALRCQVMIDVTRRHYTAKDQERLFELFGEPERWGQTLRAMLWTHTNVGVPGFYGASVIDLPVACTFDFNVAATKYFAGLEYGEIPLTFLFSGTIFYESEEGALQVSQIPWNKEATYRLSVPVWKNMMDAYYPNTAWLCLRKDVFDRLYEHKVRNGLTSWEQALERLLDRFEETGKK